ncbi:hypothetical protein GCM10010149_64620 [Nonomuraea roseoviolacea subsp. roseoviolacea]
MPPMLTAAWTTTGVTLRIALACMMPGAGWWQALSDVERRVAGSGAWREASHGVRLCMTWGRVWSGPCVA